MRKIPNYIIKSPWFSLNKLMSSYRMLDSGYLVDHRSDIHSRSLNDFYRKERVRY